jgi:uncharacterized protein (DUF3084 family)
LSRAQIIRDLLLLADQSDHIAALLEKEIQIQHHRSTYQETEYPFAEKQIEHLRKEAQLFRDAVDLIQEAVSLLREAVGNGIEITRDNRY